MSTPPGWSYSLMRPDCVKGVSMEKRKTGAGSRWAKGRRRELEKGPSLSAWLRCYAQDEQSAEEAVRRAQNAQESAQKANPLARELRRK